MLASEFWDAWLDPTNNDLTALQAMLAPSTAGTLVHYPVDSRVGDVRNNDAGCVEPLAIR